jgi:hypothetical protein
MSGDIMMMAITKVMTNTEVMAVVTVMTENMTIVIDNK